MKSCDEMVNSLLERREQYLVEQKRRRKRLTATGTSVCCVCLVALLGVGIWQGGFFNPVPQQTTEDALYPCIKDTFDESKKESPHDPAANNKIVVHQIDGMSGDRYNICLLGDDFVPMDRDELKAYYGINIFPAVPQDLREWEDQQVGIYRRDGGTGEVYWDGTVFNYSNEDFSRTVNVEVKKDTLPLVDYAFYRATEEKSVINNIEVAIGRTEGGTYYAQLLHCNVGFQIAADGLTQDEFVAVVSSLIQ